MTLIEYIDLDGNRQYKGDIGDDYINVWIYMLNGNYFASPRFDVKGTGHDCKIDWEKIASTSILIPNNVRRYFDRIIKQRAFL